MNRRSWDDLGIEPTTDRSAIEKAYASGRKRANPEEDPLGFQTLRMAYEGALDWAREEAELEAILWGQEKAGLLMEAPKASLERSPNENASPTPGAAEDGIANGASGGKEREEPPPFRAGAMTVFTTIRHLKRRGIPGNLVRRYGKDYQLVTVGPESLDQARGWVGGQTSERIVATVRTRDEVAGWIRRHDRPGVPWPKYTFESV